MRGREGERGREGVGEEGGRLLNHPLREKSNIKAGNSSCQPLEHWTLSCLHPLTTNVDGARVHSGARSHWSQYNIRLKRPAPQADQYQHTIMPRSI